MRLRLGQAPCALVVLLSGLAGAGDVLAEEGTAADREAKEREAEIDLARCEYLRGVADAESAVLVAPSVFTRLGYIDAGAATGSTLPLGTPSARITAGLSYSFSRLQQGLVL